MIETPHAFFALESPAPGESPPAGRVVARGWLVAKPGNHFVDLRARVGQRMIHGTYGLPRRDLASHFRTRESHLLAAFEQPLHLVPGANVVVLEACTLAGEWLAAFAPVAGTNWVAIVQERRQTAIESAIVVPTP